MRAKKATSMCCEESRATALLLPGEHTPYIKFHQVECTDSLCLCPLHGIDASPSSPIGRERIGIFVLNEVLRSIVSFSVAHFVHRKYVIKVHVKCELAYL